MRHVFTTREKVLLVILAVLVIAVGYWKLILTPINDSIADLNAQTMIEVLYRLTDKLIALGVIAISAERLGNAHLIHRFVHGLNDAGGEG